MFITDLIHDPEKKVSDFKPDLFIAGSGYESRSVTLPRKLGDPGKRNVVLAYRECQKELFRKENDSYFTSKGYDFINARASEAPDFNTLFSEFTSRELYVLVDITVMPRTWYHALFRYLHVGAGFRKVHLRIVYCPSLFFEPGSIRRKIEYRELAMIDAPVRKKRVEKELALLIGLGSEKRLSSALVEKMKPGMTTLLYADPAIHKSYVETVFVSNHALINGTDIKNLVPYPLMDTETAYRIMLDHLLPARNHYRVMIVPQGPKMFSVLAMVLQVNYPDVGIVCPSFKVKHFTDKKPFANHLSLDIVFEPE